MSDYSLSEYEKEKELGLRRESGALNLKKLKPIHYEIIKMHLAGNSNASISQRLGKTQATISRILSDPLVIAELDSAYQSEKSRLRALTGKAVDAVDDALSQESITTRLRGVDRFVKMNEKLQDKEDSGMTAEDVIERIMNNIQVNVQVNTDGREDSGE